MELSQLVTLLMKTAAAIYRALIKMAEAKQNTAPIPLLFITPPTNFEFYRFLMKSVEAIDMTSPTKNIHATRFGTGLPTTISSAMIIPAISMIIIPTFIALLNDFIYCTSANPDIYIVTQRYPSCPQ